MTAAEHLPNAEQPELLVNPDDLATQALLNWANRRFIRYSSRPASTLDLDHIADADLPRFIDDYMPNLFAISYEPPRIPVSRYVERLYYTARKFARSAEHDVVDEPTLLPPAYGDQLQPRIAAYAEEQADAHLRRYHSGKNNVNQPMLATLLVHQFEVLFREKHTDYTKQYERLVSNYVRVRGSLPGTVQERLQRGQRIDSYSLRRLANNLEHLSVGRHVLPTFIELPTEQHAEVVRIILDNGLQAIELSQALGVDAEGAGLLPLKTALQLAELAPITEIEPLLRTNPELALPLYRELTARQKYLLSHSSGLIANRLNPDSSTVQDYAAMVARERWRRENKRKSDKAYHELTEEPSPLARTLFTDFDTPVFITEPDVPVSIYTVNSAIAKNLRTVAQETMRQSLTHNDDNLTQTWLVWGEGGIEKHAHSLTFHYFDTIRNLSFTRLEPSEEDRAYSQSEMKNPTEMASDSFQVVRVAVELHIRSQEKRITTVRFAIYRQNAPRGPRIVCKPLP